MQQFRAVLAALLLMILPTGSPAQLATSQPSTLPEYSIAARAARLSGNAASWLAFGRKALSLAPDHPDLLISVARASAANGKITDALPLLERAARRGAGFDARRFPEFAGESSAEFMRINKIGLANLRVVPRARLFADLAPDSSVEGIAYDPD